jgi:hypothetical protein
MNLVQGEIYTVLTGDIVGSSRLPDSVRLDLRQVLNQASGKVSRHFHKNVPYKIVVFRGDSWQFVVSDPSKSLRIGLFLRSLIREGMKAARVDTRIAIGFGTISFIPDDNLSSGDGEAFRLSGEALEKLPKDYRMSINFPKHFQTDLTDALDIIVKLIDLQAIGWTQKQARAISGAILGLTQVEIAERWFEKEITQQAIAQHLDRAGWSIIELGIDFFETVIPRLFNQA